MLKVKYIDKHKINKQLLLILFHSYQSDCCESRNVELSQILKILTVILDVVSLCQIMGMIPVILLQTDFTF